MSQAAKMGLTTTPLTPPTARTYGLLTFGWLLFILYGSLVPFQFATRPAAEIPQAFSFAMMHRWAFESRADALANLLLGIPLGFGLLAWRCVDRPSLSRAVLWGLAFLPLTMIFATAVEFLQLFCPTRTSAGSDVLMQWIGVLIGQVGWVVFGPRLTDHLRTFWAGPRIGGSAGRMLLSYLAFLALMQALPLDLTLSPKDVYKNLRDKTFFLPWSEFGAGSRWDRYEFWHQVRGRLETLGLFLPVGLLAGCLPGGYWQSSRNRWPILALSLIVAGVLEGEQVFVMSRQPKTSDVLVGGIGAWLGWVLARRAGRREFRAVLASLWVGVLMVAYWQPFVFTLQVSKVEWLVLLPLENRNPLTALSDLLSKLVLFSLLGVLACREFAGESRRRRLWAATASGVMVSTIIELGQVVQPGHTPSVTDGLMGALGGWFGGAATIRALPPRAESPAPRGVGQGVNWP